MFKKLESGLFNRSGVYVNLFVLCSKPHGIFMDKVALCIVYFTWCKLNKTAVDCSMDAFCVLHCLCLCKSLNKCLLKCLPILVSCDFLV